MPTQVLDHLIFEMLACFFIWVPFALAALIIEEWGASLARRWRDNIAHPIKAVRRYRSAHAHAHAHAH